MTEKAVCPYCQKALEKKHVQKKKCPHCENHIYVKKGKLLTEEDVEIEKAMSRLQDYNVTKKDFDKIREEQSKQFGQKASVNDTVWRILTELIITSPDYASVIYQDMAQIALSEGKDPTPYLIESLKAQIQWYQEQGVYQSITVQNCNDSHVCSVCKMYSGKEFSLDDAPIDLPSRCTSELGCRCWFTSEVSVEMLWEGIDNVLMEEELKPVREKPWWKVW